MIKFKEWEREREREREKREWWMVKSKARENEIKRVNLQREREKEKERERKYRIKRIKRDSWLNRKWVRISSRKIDMTKSIYIYIYIYIYILEMTVDSNNLREFLQCKVDCEKLKVCLRSNMWEKRVFRSSCVLIDRLCS